MRVYKKSLIYLQCVLYYSYLAAWGRVKFPLCLFKVRRIVNYFVCFCSFLTLLAFGLAVFSLTQYCPVSAYFFMYVSICVRLILPAYHAESFKQSVTSLL